MLMILPVLLRLYVASDGIRDTGAVASSRAAEIYGLDILAARIQGYSERVINCDIFLTKWQIPYWFNHQQMGSSISFDMPLDVENGLVGITLWVVYASKDWTCKSLSARAYINDKRNAVEWAHSAAHKGTIACEEILWVSHLALRYFGHPIKGGERIEVSIAEDQSVKVQECGIHLVYKRDDEEENVVHNHVDDLKG